MLQCLRQLLVVSPTVLAMHGRLLDAMTPCLVLKTLCIPVTVSMGNLNLPLIVVIVDRLELPAPLTWLISNIRLMTLMLVLVPSPGTILCIVAFVATMLLMSSIPTLLVSRALITTLLLLRLPPLPWLNAQLIRTLRLEASVTVADMVSGTFPQVGLNIALTLRGRRLVPTLLVTPLVQNVFSAVTP